MQGLNGPGTHQFSHHPHHPHALSLCESPFQKSPPQLSSHSAQMQLHTQVVSCTQSGLTVRHAHVDVDCAHVDGVDAAGANGRGVNADGARGMGVRGANVD